MKWERNTQKERTKWRDSKTAKLGKGPMEVIKK